MTSPSTEVRRATPDDMPDAVAAIVAAFITDPAARFAWPAARDYLQAMPLATREFAGSSFEHETAYFCAGALGAALWLPPGAGPNEEALDKVFNDTADPEHLGDLLATFEKMGQWHPKEPHWYLAMIGVDPRVQGQGVGAALMRHGVARCDKEHAVAYLETANPRNVPLYRRFGFEVIGEFQAGAAPAMTPMLRRPR